MTTRSQSMHVERQRMFDDIAFIPAFRTEPCCSSIIVLTIKIGRFYFWSMIPCFVASYLIGLATKCNGVPFYAVQRHSTGFCA